MTQLIMLNINKRRIMEIILIYSIILSINTLEIEQITKGVGLYNVLYIEEKIQKIMEIIIYIIGIIIGRIIIRTINNKSIFRDLINN